jgi:peptidyl-prolyl cis-trans isomerase B (cyclophilin B)
MQLIPPAPPPPAAPPSRSWVWAVIGVAAMAVLCCGGGGVVGALYLTDQGRHETAASHPPHLADSQVAASTSASPVAGRCTYTPTAQPASRPVTAPDAASYSTDPAVAVLTTNLGVIAVTLATTKAPCTVASLRSLATQNYFDGTACHRVTTIGLYVLQCGDPSGTGTGGPGYRFADENLPTATTDPYPRGTVAMANAGPGTNGSQFFICQQDDRIPATYTVLGTVTTGMPIVDQVTAAGSDNANNDGDGHPSLPITITTLTVQPA